MAAPEAHGAPTRPEPIDPAQVRRGFHHGKRSPRGVSWFALSSFWGHLRHLLASGIATEDVDSRDWMSPDKPDELCWRIAQQLGASERAPTLLQSLDRDLWIDYVADTGDDVEVSEAVARLIFREYELPDPDTAERSLLTPRGDILFFGGDTAYPVATSDEVTNRVLSPYNQWLQQVDDGKARVLLGIPGNHDWYDGLDGFARLFRRPFENEGKVEASLVPAFKNPLQHAARWTRKFIAGGRVEKPKRLGLLGYRPVQNASYFILPLSPDLHLCAVDRQLKAVDGRQQKFVHSWQRTHARSTPWVVAPDPVYGFCQPRETGREMVDALQLHYGEWNSFVLTGDIHHYQRFTMGKTFNVIAGGGGAFLHNAPLHQAQPELEGGSVERQWPSAGQCRSMLWQVPWQVASGRSGLIPHLLIALVFAPVVGAHLHEHEHGANLVLTYLALLMVFWPLLSLLGGVRTRSQVAWVALAPALAVVAVGALAHAVLSSHWVQQALPPLAAHGLALGFCAIVGSAIFGAYLAILTRLGLEHTQAFTALGHPGFKHFLRLRVRKGGQHVDGWCIGMSDPLDPHQKPELVDQFTWTTQG